MTGATIPRVLVLWASQSSRNLGVRALGAGVEQIVRETWPGCQVEHWNSLSDEGVPDNFAARSRWFELVWPGEITRALGGFDVVIDTRSGDSFSDIYGLRRHLKMSLIAILAGRSSRVVLAPQTIGPFESRLGRLIASLSVRKAAIVATRDPKSSELANRLFEHAIVGSTDVAFALSSSKDVSGTRDVLLNVSGLLWEPNPHVDCFVYQERMISLLDAMARHGRRVSLLTHVIPAAEHDSDGPPLAALAKHAAVVEVVEPQDLVNARAIIASANIVVAARMHACLNALSQGVPAIALEYSDKFRPLMKDLGWEHSYDLRASTFDERGLLADIMNDGLADEAEILVARAHARLENFRQALRDLQI